MMTKTEKKIQNRIRFGGFKSGAECVARSRC